jgi:hypothetical protein
MTLYRVTVTIKSKVGQKVTDEKAETLLKSSRFDGLTAAIAIAVNNFNRACDEFMAEVRD